MTGADDDIDELDREALQRAMDIANRNPMRARQRAEKLTDEPWIDVAEFAAYCVQGEALALKPWQEPPCMADEDDPRARDKDAQRLLRRMLKAGLSRYEPNPRAALAKSNR
jgi:hypothetical protein